MAVKKELKVGDKAPTFALLKELKGKTVVLYFYPKDMTPGCTTQACDFRDSMARLKKAGAAVVGVSRDTAESHGKFTAKHDLNFPLIDDVDGKLCEAYGVWQQKSLYGRKFMGIVRTTFVISPSGKIAHVFPKVKVKGHVDAVLAAVAE